MRDNSSLDFGSWQFYWSVGPYILGQLRNSRVVGRVQMALRSGLPRRKQDSWLRVADSRGIAGLKPKEAEGEKKPALRSGLPRRKQDSWLPGPVKKTTQKPHLTTTTSLFHGGKELSLVDFEFQTINLTSKLLILPSHFHC